MGLYNQVRLFWLASTKCRGSERYFSKFTCSVEKCVLGDLACIPRRRYNKNYILKTIKPISLLAERGLEQVCTTSRFKLFKCKKIYVIVLKQKLLPSHFFLLLGGVGERGHN